MNEATRERIALSAALVLTLIEKRMPGGPVPHDIARALGGVWSDDRETSVLGMFGYFIKVSFLDSSDDLVVQHYQRRLKEIGVLVADELRIDNDDLDILDETIRRESADDEAEMKTALKWLSRFRDFCRALRFKELKAAKGG